MGDMQLLSRVLNYEGPAPGLEKIPPLPPDTETVNLPYCRRGMFHLPIFDLSAFTDSEEVLPVATPLAPAISDSILFTALFKNIRHPQLMADLF